MCPECRADAVDDTAQVHVDGPLPVPLVELLEQAADRDAGVVDHDIEAAVRVHGVADQGPHGIGVGDVDDGCRGPGPQLTSHRLGLGDVEVGDDDVAAAGDQLGGDGPPDAGSCSCHDRDAGLEAAACHGFPFSWSARASDG